MSLRLRALELHVPDVVARSALRRLSRRRRPRSAASPWISTRWIAGRCSNDTYRSRPAAPSRRCRTIPSSNSSPRRMWENAYALGKSIRRRLGVRTPAEALRAARIAYRMIGIDLRADRHGHVVVDRCTFAESYSPQICLVMSALDAGLIAGLTRGGRLAFSERITEGRPQCVARISWEGAST